MASLAVQRLESLLQTKHLDRTVTKDRSESDDVTVRASSGLPSFDRRLGGGWRRGAISELVGRASAGRTSVMLSTLARATADDEQAALVDAVDRLDVTSAARMGVNLDRLLWVRGPALVVEAARLEAIDRAVRHAVRAFDLILRAGGLSVAILDLADIPPRVVRALPPATWLRLAQVNEGKTTAALMVGDAPMGRSARGQSIRLDIDS